MNTKPIYAHRQVEKEHDVAEAMINTSSFSFPRNSSNFFLRLDSLMHKPCECDHSQNVTKPCTNQPDRLHTLKKEVEPSQKQQTKI